MRNLPETVHAYNIPKLNVLFIVSSVLLILCVIWMLADDFYREWKPYQRQAKAFEIQKLREDRAAAEKKMEEAGFAGITGKLAQEETKLRANAGEIARLRADLERIRANLAVQKIKYATEKALLDQRKSEYDEAVELHRGEKAVGKKLGALRGQETAVNAVDLEIQDIERQKLAAEAALSRFTAEKETLEKEKRRLGTEKGLIEKRLAYLGSRLLPALLDQPLIEFAQPTISVQQVIAEDQTYSLNFADVARIDRCISCHTFSDKKDAVAEGEEGFRFANLPQPWRAHPRLDLFVASDSPHPVGQFGCSVCHQGWDRGAEFVHAAHTPEFLTIRRDYVKMPLVEGAARWVAISAVEKWQPGLVAKAKERVRLAEEFCALKTAKLHSASKLKETRAALVTAEKELKSQFGMDRGQLEKFRFASLTQEQAWEESLHWHPMHHKEDPMRPREFTESSCIKCHQNVTDVPVVKDPTGTSEASPGEKINAGLRLIEQAGCYACHRMQALETSVKRVVKPGENLETLAHTLVAEPTAILAANGLKDASEIKTGRELIIPVRAPYPKPGPSLIRIASKTSKEWMIKWLENPKAFRPNTFMPQFWNLDNNRNGACFEGSLTGRDGKPIRVDWVDRNAVETRSITEYLFKLSEPSDHSPPPSGNPARGEALVNSVGCMGCHVMDQKLTDIPPKERRFRSQGPMLFGSGSKYNAGWLYSWLKDPVRHRHDTRMPNLRLADQEAADITAYLMANRNTEFDERKTTEIKVEVLKDTTVDYLKDEKPFKQAIDQAKKMGEEEQFAYLGEKLVQRYGCMDCHSIKGMENAKPISIELSDWAGKNPGKLDFGFIEIPRNNFAFLHQKLQAPRSFDRVTTKRPQELLRMPQFNFTEDQIELIMTAIMGMTGETPGAKARRNLTETEWRIENGRWLIKELNCMGCHINEGRGGAIRSAMDEDKTFLFPPSLDGLGIKVRPAWLHAFLKNPGQHRFRYWLDARMPIYPFSDDQINALTQYFALRDKQPYPFETDTMETAAYSPPKESLDAGEKIVVKGGCMQCHQVRTAEQAVAAGNPAIDFAMVKHRMRPKGLTAWLRNPGDASKGGAVTPGVNMPAFWNEGQPNPLPDILNGDTEKQIQAVADYIRVYREPPPASPPPKVPPTAVKPARQASAKP
ncbi:MAG: c-type cytochrome [Verrucomicrobia bacterium]|nr:c-type cytochrome [Verrucomicrobiota bacterium]